MGRIGDFAREVASRRLARHSAMMYAGSGAAAVAGVLRTVVLTRLLLLEEFGRMTLAIELVNTLQAFLSLQVAEAVTRFATRHLEQGRPGRARTVFARGLQVDAALSLVTFLAAYVGAPLLAACYRDPESLVGLLRVFAFYLLANTAHGAMTSILGTYRRFGQLATWQGIEAAAGLALPAALAWIYRDPRAALWGLVASEAVGGAVLLVFVVRCLRKELAGVAREPLGSEWREVGGFSLSTTISSTLKSLRGSADVLLLGTVASYGNLGVYKVAKSLAAVLTNVPGPLRGVVYPSLTAAHAREDLAHIAKILRAFTLSCLAVALPPAILLWVFASDALRLICGEGYASGGPLLRILLPATLLGVAVAWGRVFSLAVGRPDYSVWLGLLHLGLVVGPFLALPGVDAARMAWIVMGSSIVVNGLMVFWAERDVGFLGRPWEFGARASPPAQGEGTSGPDWDEYRDWHGTTAFPESILRAHAGTRVLDVGCGVGGHLAGLGEAAVRVGIELTGAGLEEGRRLHPEVGFVRADATRLPFRDGAFDTVLMIDVIEHIPATDRVLAETARALAPGGRLLVQTPNYPVKRVYDALNWARGRRPFLADDPTHVRPFSAARLEDALRERFEVLDLEVRNLLFEGAFTPLRGWKRSRIGRLLGQKIIAVATPRPYV